MRKQQVALLAGLAVGHAVIAIASGNPWLALDKIILVVVAAWIGHTISNR